MGELRTIHPDLVATYDKVHAQAVRVTREQYGDAHPNALQAELARLGFTSPEHLGISARAWHRGSQLALTELLDQLTTEAKEA